MGIGGVRGMLITLSAISNNEVNPSMVFAFTFGVMLIFMAFGFIIALVNDSVLTSRRNVRAAFAVAGTVSLIVGGEMLV